MKRALVLGGTGFLGSAFVRRLASADFRVRVPTRRPERAKFLTVLPTVEGIAADIHDAETLAALCAGMDVVANFVGILRGDFSRTHVELPAKIGQAAAAAGVRRLLHVSALGADPAGRSAYQRSKAAGEVALRKAFPEATIFRPSVIFGRGDSFLSLFARLLRFAPIVPLAAADAELQPVWVEDVAAVMTDSLWHSESRGQTYALCGPRRYTLRELVKLAGAYSGHPRPIVPLPDPLAYLQAWLMEIVGGPMTRDNLLSLMTPNVCREVGGLPFGREATPLEAVAPDYLAEI